jgi:hypothetical protein
MGKSRYAGRYDVQGKLKLRWKGRGGVRVVNKGNHFLTLERQRITNWDVGP